MKSNEIDIRLISLSEDRNQTHMYRWEMLRYTGATIDVELSTAFRVNRRRKTVSLLIGAHYTTLRTQILRHLLDYVIEAEFEVSDFNGVVDQQSGELLISTDMLSLMLSVGIGALRGMLALRTEGTFLSHFPLPVYDLDELIDNVVASGQNIAVPASA